MLVTLGGEVYNRKRRTIISTKTTSKTPASRGCSFALFISQYFKCVLGSSGVNDKVDCETFDFLGLLRKKCFERQTHVNVMIWGPHFVGWVDTQKFMNV